MPAALCCFGEKPNRVRVDLGTDKRTFRDRLPEHIKCLTVDVSYKSVDAQPQCVQSPRNRAWDYRDNN